MGYSAAYAKDERNQEVRLALEARDAEHLCRLADLFKAEDDDEMAETLKNHAKRIDKEDWSYDESIGN